MESSDDNRPTGRPAPLPSVLIVEDVEPLRRAYARILEAAGFQAWPAASAEDAIDILADNSFDVVVSDISLGRGSGIDVLRAVREHDLDAPVILVTANPTIDTATRAVEYGALRYLVKPVENPVLVEAVQRAATLYRVAKLKRESATYLGANDRMVGDQAGLEARFERALSRLWMAYQPIVNPETRQVVAFEAFVRSDEPSLPEPAALLSAAERLGRSHELGRAVRWSVARAVAERKPRADIFINLHPSEVLDDDLYADGSPLSSIAHRVVFEITERASLDRKVHLGERIQRLRELGYRIAIDDLGAGYAGLNYFALLSPDIVKLDMSLVRGVHQEPVKQRIIGSMTSLCRELGMSVVAEGVETQAEGDAVVRLGCDLMQGFLFARPGPPFPIVAAAA